MTFLCPSLQSPDQRREARRAVQDLPQVHGSKAPGHGEAWKDQESVLVRGAEIVKVTFDTPRFRSLPAPPLGFNYPVDIFLTLRDGRTAPLEGVTSIASIDSVGTATAFIASAIASGSPNVTVSSTTGILPGSMVYGSGIPTGATVLSVTSGTVFVMSANATATIGSLTITVAAVSTADQKLLTVNSGWYRDIFTAATALQYTGGTPVANLPIPVPTLSGIIFTNPAVTPPSNSGATPISGSITGTLNASTSDEVNHAALRQATWLESLWAFTCTTDAVIGPTLTLYYRKYEVIGFCNSAPSL